MLKQAYDAVPDTAGACVPRAAPQGAGGGDGALGGFAHHVPAFTLAVVSAVAAVTIAKRRVWVRDLAAVVVLAAVIFSVYAPSGSRLVLIRPSKASWCAPASAV